MSELLTLIEELEEIEGALSRGNPKLSDASLMLDMVINRLRAEAAAIDAEKAKEKANAT